MKLSIIIPIYNEASTIGAILDKVLSTNNICDDANLSKRTATTFEKKSYSSALV